MPTKVTAFDGKDLHYTVEEYLSSLIAAMTLRWGIFLEEKIYITL